MSGETETQQPSQVPQEEHLPVERKCFLAVRTSVLIRRKELVLFLLRRIGPQAKNVWARLAALCCVSCHLLIRGGMPQPASVATNSEVFKAKK